MHSYYYFTHQYLMSDKKVSVSLFKFYENDIKTQTDFLSVKYFLRKHVLIEFSRQITVKYAIASV